MGMNEILRMEPKHPCFLRGTALVRVYYAEAVPKGRAER